MSVLFNNIPGNMLVPFAYFEINSGGTPFQGLPRVLLIGQQNAGSLATAGAVFGPIQNQAEADAQFGVGSMLSAMFAIARRNAPFQPIWALPIADPAGGSVIDSAARAAVEEILAALRHHNLVGTG